MFLTRILPSLGATAIAVWMALPSSASACAFHSYTPDPTIVDILLGSEHVVVARPGPNGSPVPIPQRALLGGLDGVALPAIKAPDILARLWQTPGSSVLFARDGAYGPWVELAVLDRRYETLIKTVIAKQPVWSIGGIEDRYQLFANRLNDANPDIRTLALRELDGADYSVLRHLRLPRVQGLRDDVSLPDDLRPIRVLLAGLSGDLSKLPTLRAEFQAAIARDAAYLGAFPTALIELGGAAQVRIVAETYIADNAMPLTQREKIIEALAIHATSGAPQTQRAVRDAMTRLLAQDPSLAAATARQFGFRGDWTLAEPLAAAAARQAPRGIEDIFAVNQYLGIAGRPSNP